jgi:hypothetical protein
LPQGVGNLNFVRAPALRGLRPSSARPSARGLAPASHGREDSPSFARPAAVRPAAA